jgi:O-antigen ligase
MWSDYPGVAFKRWIKAIGDLVIVLIVVTEADPVAALKRLFSRIGFVLFPLSILLIRYYGDLGRGYDPDGRPMNTGVTTNKNTLGVITLVISLGALWNFLNLLRTRGQVNRAQHLLARGTLLAFGVALLALANSATSSACFALGTLLILTTYLPSIRRRPGAVHALVAAIVLVGGLAMLFGGQAGVVHALGRESNLTGRTEIWAAVLPVVPNPIVGSGFESFWLPPRLQKVWSNLSEYMHVNEAHNGYIEVYLNLGWVGVSLIAVILITGYRGAISAFRRDPAFGGLMLAYVAAAAIYAITEAGFRPLLPIWIFLLLAVVGSHRIASRAAGGTKRARRVSAYGATTPSAHHATTLGNAK